MASKENKYNANAIETLSGIIYDTLSPELGHSHAARLMESLVGKIARQLNGLVYIGKRASLPMRNAEILARHEDGVSRAELAGEYGLTTKRVGVIIREAKQGKTNISLPHYNKTG